MNTTPSSRHRIAVHRRPRSIALMLAAALMLLLSTVSADWPTAAAQLEDEYAAPAEGDSNATPVSGTPGLGDQDDSSVIVESTPVATESVIIAPTVAVRGTAALNRERPGTVEVTVRLCPPNVELPNLDDRRLLSACEALSAGVAFHLDDGSGLAVSRRTGTAGLSKVRFHPVDPGSVTLRQVPTPDAASVFCGGNTQAKTTTTYGPAYFDGRYLHLDVRSGELMQCDWYVTDPGMDEATFENSSFLINVLQCPTGVDVGTGSMSDYARACQEDPNPVEFTYTQAGSPLPIITMTNANDRFSATVNPGPVTITQTIPGGFGEPIVFCTGQNPTLANIRVGVADGNSIEWNLLPGQKLMCNWFITQPGSGTVHLHASDCPPGYDASEPDPNAMRADCRFDPASKVFTLTDGTGRELASDTTSRSDSGDLAFGDVTAGQITISGQVPAGFQAPVVWCGATGKSSASGPATRMDVSGGDQITWNLEPGSLLTCDWYNIPAAPPPAPGSGTARIVIANYWCSPSVVWGTAPTESDYKAACRESPSTATFTLEGGGQDWPSQTAQGGPPETVSWAGLPPGDYTVAETSVAHARTPQVFCHESFGNEAHSVPAQVSRDDDGGIQWAARAGVTLTCNWFNFAAESGSLTLRLWTCPPGYDPFATGAEPSTGCTEATSGITFLLDDLDVFELVYLESRTGDAGDGVARFEGLRPGPYRIREAVPDGTSLVFVGDCDGLNNGPMHSPPLSVGPELDIQVVSGRHIVCDWYNVPARASDVSSTTIFLHARSIPMGRSAMGNRGIG